jgi:hypothetical protein
MSKQNDGGPAFPHQQPRHLDQHALTDFYHGMSLRDWFAGQVMEGVCTWLIPSEPPETDETLAKLARDSYRVADAMLKAREGKR